MTIVSGTKLGPYEIPSAIGAGGWARSVDEPVPGDGLHHRGRSGEVCEHLFDL